MCLYNELLVAICFQLFLIRLNCKSGSRCCETFAPNCESQAIYNYLMGALSKYNVIRDELYKVLNNLASVNIALDFPI